MLDAMAKVFISMELQCVLVGIKSQAYGSVAACVEPYFNVVFSHHRNSCLQVFRFYHGVAPEIGHIGIGLQHESCMAHRRAVQKILDADEAEHIRMICLPGPQHFIQFFAESDGEIYPDTQISCVFQQLICFFASYAVQWQVSYRCDTIAVSHLREGSGISRHLLRRHFFQYPFEHRYHGGFMDISCRLSIVVSEEAAVFRIRGVPGDMETSQRFAVGPRSMAFLVEKEYRRFFIISVEALFGRKLSFRPAEIIPGSSQYPSVSRIFGILS